MKISLTAATLAALVLAAPAFAGDAAKGEKEFNKCKTCHSIIAPDGTEIVKGAKTGPNLYGVVGRTAGTYPEFKYKDSIVALGASGFAWTEEDIATYVKDPGAFLKEKTDDKKAKSGMAFKLAKGGEDVAAYLASVVK
ncbi:cytochrome C [Rhodobacter capsulatus]|uniref:Cytochrome c n=1 Tax=Rhodobacter capsulatus TaxID=1061 RepID=A0A1G7N9X5_RHOCA|nr:cytochrome C [Rhodobacter capsulatus]PZX23825.1 cytochrome c [Rhodobacter capsulatus]QNR62236.1 cytochrome C [Rhodobacter capsulatus]WER08227.1 cytochrome C [Rhodobacter capsulatus]SDF70110.1 cytochrome c [Rhodobacter capsulatus]